MAFTFPYPYHYQKKEYSVRVLLNILPNCGEKDEKKAAFSDQCRQIRPVTIASRRGQ